MLDTEGLGRRHVHRMCQKLVILDNNQIKTDAAKKKKKHIKMAETERLERRRAYALVTACYPIKLGQ